MAQELIDKIRAAAQAKNVDPDVAVKIAQAESGFNPEAGAKTSSAKGLFQIVNKTWSGAGGKPGQQKDPDENIRVGTNIIASNTDFLRKNLGRDPRASEIYAAHFFGPAGATTLLAAAPDTPASQLFSEKVLKANPQLQGKTADQIRGMLQQKMGEAGSAPAAKEVPGPTPAEQIMEPALRSGMTASAADLGSGYKAALALSFLGDEEDSDEKKLDEEEKQAAKALAEHKSFNALNELEFAPTKVPMLTAQAQPQMPVQGLAEGGVPYTPTATIRPSAKQQLADIKAQYDAYNTNATAYNDALKKYQTDVYDPYMAKVDAYNKAAEAWNAGPRTSDFTAVAPTAPAEFSMTAPTAPTTTQEQYTAMGEAAKRDAAHRNLALQVASNPEQFGLSINKMFADGGDVSSDVPEPWLPKVSSYSHMTAYDMYPGQQGQFDQQDAARHMLAAGTLARKYGPGVAEALGQAHEITTSPLRWIGSKLGISQMPVDYEQDLHNNRLGIELAARSKSQRELEDLVQREAERARSQQTPGTAWIGKPVRRADGSPEGGERALTPEEIEAASKPAFLTPKSGIGRKISTKPGEIEAAVLQGVSETPYNLLGAPVDLATMIMRPFGYDVQAPTGGSEWIKQKMSAAGVRPQPPTQPTQQAFYELGQLGGSLINPAAPVRGAVAGAQATGKAAKALMKDFQEYNRALDVPGASYAVKPKGGTVLYTHTGEGGPLPISKLDNLMMEYRVTAARDQDASDELVNFIKQKAPKYFTTTFGTADDPLRTAIRERAIEPFGRDLKKIPPYLVDAAKFPQARGHLQAKHELERMYDEMTGVNPWVLKPEDRVVPGSMEQRRMINQKMAQEGVPAEAQNAPSVDAYTRGEFSEFPTSTKMLRDLVQAESSLPSNIQHALRSGEVMYDINPYFDLFTPSNVVDALKQIPPDKLKRMSFPEALIQGTQALAPIRDYRTAIDMADRGAKIPPAVLQQFTAPVTRAPGGEWVRITEPVATELEGKLMKHSVGGYSGGDSYGTGYTELPYGGKLAFEDDIARVFSLRDKEGMPTITVEVARPKNQQGWNVTQVRGRFNSEPMDKESVFNLFDTIEKSEGLNRIKPNSYTRSASGADLEQGSVVDWGGEYEKWKQGISE